MRSEQEIKGRPGRAISRHPNGEEGLSEVLQWVLGFGKPVNHCRPHEARFKIKGRIISKAGCTCHKLDSGDAVNPDCPIHNVL